MTELKIALSIEEAADYTGIGRNTLRNLVEWKKLPVLRVGRKVLIKTDTVQDFYRSYHASASASIDYQSKVESWESTYGESEKPKVETIAERMERYQKEKTEQHYKQNYQKKDRGMR
jgi:excisionase family DNA binding protein